MIKEKLNYISLSFYLLVGALESQKKKNRKKRHNIFATSNQIEANG